MKNKLIYLPFEELPQRYTKMWNDSFCAAMQEGDLCVWGKDKSDNIIANGEFLDVCNTIAYKQSQIEEVAALFNAHQINDGDVFFVPDIFYPALEAIRYMSELMGIKVKIAAFNHAGRADNDDFVQRLGAWSDTQEQAWHDMCDLVLVGSEYHKRRVVEKFGHKNVVVTGAVWSNSWMDDFTQGIDRTKKDYVIWPHRPCAEKRFDLFLEIAKANPKVRFVITSSGNNRLQGVELPENVEYRHSLSKLDYYKVFAQADAYLSTAKQETFGYTLQEAIYFGCKVLVPDYACYREYAHRDSIYSLNNIAEKGFLTDLLRMDWLKRSRNVSDNAALFYQLCKDL